MSCRSSVLQVSLLFLALAACGDEPAPVTDGPPAGYVRFSPPPMTLAPGESGQWIHWISLPADEDRDVLDIQGYQGPGGHHLLLYSTEVEAPVGTTRPWTNADQVSTRFLGGFLGEGNGNIAPPAGAALRLKQGKVLVLQSHWINTGDGPITTDAYVDVQLVAPSDARQRVSLFTVSDIAAKVTPGLPTHETTCVLPEAVPLVSLANHVHEHGLSVRTTLTTDGSAQVLKDDPVWDPEWTLNPNFARYPLEAPLTLPAGSTVAVHCAWRNDGAKTIYFPDEMCLTFGLYVGDADKVCDGGVWRELE